MKIHADIDKDAVVKVDLLPWQNSPQKGVLRKLIERDGEEVARATSIVRYDSHSSFPEHTHDMGEEFLVLNGVFSDSAGHFGEGMYVRNPWGSSHAPYTKDGCQILVKLRQISKNDREFVRINSHNEKWQKTEIEHLEYLPLHQFGSENVALITCPADHLLWDRSFESGIEVFIIAGEVLSNNESFPKNSWFRIAPGNRQNLQAKSSVTLFVKTGHLPNISKNTLPLKWTDLLKIKEK